MAAGQSEITSCDFCNARRLDAQPRKREARMCKHTRFFGFEAAYALR